MLGGEAVVGPGLERQRPGAVDGGKRVAPVAALLVAGAHRQEAVVEMEAQVGSGRAAEALVGEKREGFRMIYGEDAHRVDVGGLAQLLGEAQLVLAVARLQALAGHEHVLGAGGRVIDALGQQHAQR